MTDIAMRSRTHLRFEARVLSFAIFALGAVTGGVGAQGVTSGAFQGRITGTDGVPVEGALVRVTSVPSGAQWQVASDAAGRYFLENVEPGGPYTIDARRIGFAEARQTGIRLGLGQRHRMDFALKPAVVSLAPITVTATTDGLLNARRMGPEHIVSERELAALPNLSRDLSVVAALAPLAVVRPLGGISVGGQNQGYNSLQVDGGVNADLYLGRSPGGASPSGSLPEVLPHAISLETVREFQVLAAPFDVRLGSFAGGLLNAVTKSGTNDLEGSVFAYVQNGKLVGVNRRGRRLDFTTWQFGGTASGAIVRNKVHFFVNADIQERVVPDPGPPSVSALRDSNLAAFQAILRDTFNIDGGSTTSDGRLPAQDLFGKITVQFGPTSRLELSQHYAHATRTGFMDVGRTHDSTALSSIAGRSQSTALTSRAMWSLLLRDRVQSELILSYARLRDSCRPNARYPLIQVQYDSGTLMAGPNSVCPTTDIDQDVLEMTGNLTIGTGRHVLTLGTRAELLHFEDPLVQVSAGRWEFSSLDSLAAGLAKHYDRGLPAPPPRSPGADFRAIGLGAYAQDRWDPSDRLTLTVGLRVDVPLLPDEARTNPDLLDRAIDTGRLPSGQLLLSPRLGFNYDLRGDGRGFLRGGAGLFAGPPPYRWVGNGYRDSGDEMLVSCDSTFTPPFTPDPARQPTTCNGGGGTSPRISYFAPGFRFPQNLKLALGLDHRLAGGIIATFDVVYTRAIHQVYITQDNIEAPTIYATREGNRPLYGIFLSDTSRTLTTAWRDTSDRTREIYRLSNARGDHALSLTAQFRKEFGDMLGVQASYAFTRARDRMSIVNFPARANYSNTPLDGTIDNRRLRSSFFEAPHKVALSATLGRGDRAQLTFLYVGSSQPPFTYVINGDANGDGIGGSGSLKNDIVYVPLDSSDIALVNPAHYARLDEFIQRHRCLREQRGRIMARGSCRNGWLGMLNARLTTAVPVAQAPRFDLTIDVVNLPNLLSSRWGRQRDITTGPSVTLLRLSGWDSTRTRARYSVPALPQSGVLHDASSRWRVQLGAKYYLNRRR